MAHIVRSWRITPPVDAVHPKTAVLRAAARIGTFAVRAHKLDAAGTMHVVARGVSEHLAAFYANLRHMAGWQIEELVVTPADEDAIVGVGRVVVRTSDEITSGADSSGRRPASPAAAGADAASSVDTGSTASSQIILIEVRRERERGEALLLEAREAAAAAEAREAEARKAAAAAEAREAEAREAAEARETKEREAAEARKAEAREAAAAAAVREAEAAISALVRHAGMTREAAMTVLGLRPM